MAANGRSSPGAKRSRSRSPQGAKRNIQTRGRNRSRDRSAGVGGGTSRKSNPASASHRVYVANIPFDAKWTDVKDLFREKVGDVTYVELFQDESGKFRGCGVVELKETSSVSKAVDILHRFEYRGRNLVVKEDYDLERDKVGRLLPRSGVPHERERGDRSMNMNDRGYRGGGKGPSHGGERDMGYNTYGLSPQFLESLGISGPLSSKIFIANLDFKVTGRKLGEIFKIAGKIVNVDLKTDLDGNSKGHGIVEFEHPVEAVQAISMFNGQKLYNRLMSVRMDRFEHEEHDGRSKLPGGLSGIGKGLGAGGQAIHLSSMGPNMGLGANLPQGAMNMMGNTALGLNSLAAAAAAMNAGLGTGLGASLGATGLGAMGLGAGIGTSGLVAAAGLGNTGLGLGLGGGGLGGGGLGHSERTLLGNSLGGSMGLGLGNNSSIGLGSSGNSGLGFGSLGGSSNNSGGSSGLMGSLVGNSSLGGLSNLSSLGGGGMGNSQSSLGGGGLFGDYGDSSFDRAGNSLGGNSSSAGDSFHGNRQQQQQQQQQLSDTVIVRNLPVNYNWQTLRERFRDVGLCVLGDIRYTALKGRGAAVMRFNTERDAQRAVDLMNGIRIEGRAIEVRLY